MVPSDPKARAAWAYNAAADHYDGAALSFWDRFGRRTVERLAPAPGSRVLDACCGTGASALHAAERVGPGGHVVGIDLAERMLEQARLKAAARGLRNVDFRVADIESPGLPEGSFDAVVCVFGIFFLPDMAAAARSLWRLVRPGGSLALTTWGQEAFQPADTAFWEAVREERPDLCRAFAPWDRASTPDLLRALLLETGAPEQAVGAEMEKGTHPLSGPGEWWGIVMGSGYRATVEQLEAAPRERVRETVERRLAEAGVSGLNADVVYGVARKAAYEREGPGGGAQEKRR